MGVQGKKGGDEKTLETNSLVFFFVFFFQVKKISFNLVDVN